MPDKIAAVLAESLERYRAILDTAVDGIITINERGLIESFNHAAERIFGYSAKEVVGRNVSMLMPEPYHEQHDAYLGNYIASGKARIIGIGREVSGRRKDGSIFPMDLSVGELHLPDKRLFTGITRDISDRKRIEAESQRRLNELAHFSRVASVSELATGLAHEVNQPLTAIMTHAQACLRLLAAGKADAETLHDSLQQIARQSERAGEVIRRLRRFVQKGEVELKAAQLNTQVAEVLDLLQHEIRESACRVRMEIEPDLPLVEMDSVQISQVLVNLVRNALEAMAEVPESRRELSLLTRLAQGEPGVEVLVSDRGVGFTQPEQVQRLFEAYFSTKSQGMGQGLAICRTIVEAHGGRIWAEADPQGGAIFGFRMPVPPAT